jgi:tetratricopeptide (TPR) repeat protein
MNRACLGITLVAILLVLGQRVATADTLRLKNGNSLSGEVKAESDAQVTIDIPGVGEMTFARSEIVSIEKTAAAGESGHDTSEFAAAVASSGASDAVLQPAQRVSQASWDELNNEVIKLYEKKRFGEAEKAAREVLWVAEQSFGSDHTNVAKAAGNLGAILRDQRKYTEAEPFYQRALTLWENIEGSESPTVATALHNFADLYEREDKYAEAEPLLRRSLTIRQKTLKPNHPHIAFVLESYARLLKRLGRDQDAKTMAAKARQIRAQQ